MIGQCQGPKHEIICARDAVYAGRCMHDGRPDGCHFATTRRTTGAEVEQRRGTVVSRQFVMDMEMYEMVC